jgi:hypothetical protein
MNPAAQTITIAAASPRSAQAIRSGSRGNDAQSTSASQYASALSNSIMARAGASDQNADRSVQATKRPSAAATITKARVNPAKGSSASVTLRRRRRPRNVAATAGAPAKYPPALNEKKRVSPAGSSEVPTRVNLASPAGRAVANSRKPIYVLSKSAEAKDSGSISSAAKRLSSSFEGRRRGTGL